MRFLLERLGSSAIGALVALVWSMMLLVHHIGLLTTGERHVTLALVVVTIVVAAAVAVVAAAMVVVVVSPVVVALVGALVTLIVALVVVVSLLHVWLVPLVVLRLIVLLWHEVRGRTLGPWHGWFEGLAVHHVAALRLRWNKIVHRRGWSIRVEWLTLGCRLELETSV